MKNITIKPVDIPDGKYEAIWSSYTLEIQTPDRKVKAETVVGIRGINIHIKVEVSGGLVDKISYEG